MKFLSTISCVFAVASFIGAALGDEAGGEHVDLVSAGGEHVCDVHLEENQSSLEIPDLLMVRMLDCFYEDGKILKLALNVSHTTEQYRDVIKTACDKLPTISACTANVASSVHTCLNETQTATFKVLRNGLDTMMTVSCEQDGVKVADIVEQVRNLKERSVDEFTIDSCLRETEDQIKGIDGNVPSKSSTALFRMFKQARTCIAETGHEETVLKNLVESLFGDIMSKLKCIHPDSHNEVLCETIVDNITDSVVI